MQISHLSLVYFPSRFARTFFARNRGERERGRGGEGCGASGEIKTNYELFQFSCAGSLSLSFLQMKMSTDIFILIMDTSHLSELTRSFAVEIGPQ